MFHSYVIFVVLQIRLLSSKAVVGESIGQLVIMHEGKLILVFLLLDNDNISYAYSFL